MCSLEAGADVKPTDLLSVVMDRRADELGSADRAIAIVSFLIRSVVLVLRLLFHTLQVAAQLLLEGIKAGIATVCGTCGARSGRVETRGLRRRRHGGALLAIVDTLSVCGDVTKREVQPAGTWLFHVNAQVLQVASLETLVELAKRG